MTHLDEEDTGEFIVVEGMRLDLTALVREDLLLALPAKFLCREDCKGLCPICGKNLNDGSCSCKSRSIHVWRLCVSFWINNQNMFFTASLRRC